MKEELPNEKLREAEDMEIDIKELLFKCLIHWPWFVGTVVACLIAAYVYLYVATPVYNISATVLIKDDKKGGASNNVGGLDELGLSGLITSSQSIDNEIEVLRSKTLVKEVVNYLNLYVTYKDEDLIPSERVVQDFSGAGKHDSARSGKAEKKTLLLKWWYSHRAVWM